MEFDKSKVYTAFNADEVKVGSKGYFADFKEHLIERVQSDDEIHYRVCKKVCGYDDYAFLVGNNVRYRYFYLVEELKEKTKRPCTREELIEMLKKQGLPMLKNVIDDCIYTVICTSKKYVHIHSLYINNKTEQYTLQQLCEQYILLDGTELWVNDVPPECISPTPDEIGG